MPVQILHLVGVTRGAGIEFQEPLGESMSRIMGVPGVSPPFPGQDVIELLPKGGELPLAVEDDGLDLAKGLLRDATD